jgi:hypothetical protein
MKSYAKQNSLAYWVGCIIYSDGTHAEVTNAQHTEARALAIVGRIAERHNLRNGG